MLLEQLCYLDKEVCNAAELDNPIDYSSKSKKKCTVADILKDFDEEKNRQPPRPRR